MRTSMSGPRSWRHATRSGHQERSTRRPRKPTSGTNESVTTKPGTVMPATKNTNVGATNRCPQQDQISGTKCGTITNTSEHRRSSPGTRSDQPETSTWCPRKLTTGENVWAGANPDAAKPVIESTNDDARCHRFRIWPLANREYLKRKSKAPSQSRPPYRIGT